MYLLLFKLIADWAFYFSFALIFAVNVRGSYLFLLVFVPPLAHGIYSCASFYKKRRRVEYGGVFRLFIWLYIPFATLLMLIAPMRAYVQVYSLPFALVFLLSAAGVMRILQHDASVLGQRRFQLANALTLAGILVAGAGVSSARFLSAVRWVMVDGLYGLVLLAADGFFYLFMLLLGTLFPHITPLEEIAEGEMMDFSLFGEEPMNEPSGWLLTVFMILVAVAVILILWLLFKRLAAASLRLPSTNDMSMYEQYTPLSAAHKRNTRPQNGLRRVYRQFLRLCVKRGIPPVPQATSSYYTHRATTAFSLSDEANELRALYLPVRYGNRSPEKKDAAAARGLLKRIKSL